MNDNDNSTDAPAAKPTKDFWKNGSVLDVTIEALDDEGRGRGVVNEETAPFDVAVRGAFPGDRVQVVVERVFAARKLLVGKALTILDAGPLRVPRECEHDAPCPGCPLEGLEPSAALELKRGRVERALEDVGLHNVDIDDVIAHDEQYHWRQKVKLTAGGAAGHIELGMFVPHSHDLVPAHACPYQIPDVTDAIARIKPVLDASGLPPFTVDPKGIKAVVARACEPGVGVVVVVGAPLPDATWDALAALVDDDVICSLQERVDGAGGNSLVSGSLARAQGPRTLVPLEGGPAVDIDAFCQTDADQAELMYATAAEWLVDVDNCDGVFVDAYAGTGGFSKALLDRGAVHIIAVERAGSSASALAALAVEPMLVPMEEALPLLRQRGRLAGVVVDPPKKGLAELAKPLAWLDVPRVVLVSCDPDAMARDVRVLVDQGFAIVRVQPIDLYGGTPEIEVLTLLQRAPRSPR